MTRRSEPQPRRLEVRRAGQYVYGAGLLKLTEDGVEVGKKLARMESPEPPDERAHAKVDDGMFYRPARWSKTG
jgi:hypothetical protein